MERWQRMIQPGTKLASASTPSSHTLGLAFPNAQPPKAPDRLVVIRRGPAGVKGQGIGGAGYSTQLVPLPAAKALGPDAWRPTAARLRQADPTVITAFPELEHRALYELSSVDFAPAQWALRNDFNPGFDTAWHLAADRLPAAHRVPVVAVVDQGLDLDDPRLRSIAWRNTDEIAGNGLDDDGNGFVDDVHGYHIARGSADLSDDPSAPLNHGSVVSSIIACRPVGRTDDMLGVAPDTQVMTIGVMRWVPEMQTATGSNEDIFAGIQYAIENGAKIVNLSLGAGGSDALPKISQDTIASYNAHPVWDLAEQHGVLIVVAAANNDSDNDAFPALPANLTTVRPNFITVMAIDPSGQRARSYDADTDAWEPFSNYGRNSVDIAAPGTAVLGVSKPNVTCALDGTSFAAPTVAGAAALVWAQHPDWTYREVKQAILESARRVDGLDDLCRTGGMLDIDAAMDWRP
ncbi:MAG: S8 family serine peptidase [Planctomycetota bacterium]